MALFKELCEGNLPLFHLNYGIITLLPKPILSYMSTQSKLQNIYKGGYQ
jgi:hypothetical protein